MSNLQTQAIKSVKWTTLQTIFIGVSAPLFMVVKARFLTPAEFGILAIATIFLGLFQTLNNFGISQAVIQKDNISKQELSSIFFFNIILASLLGICLFFLSNVIANVFSLNELGYLLKVLSLMPIINSFSLLFNALLEKSLYFRELSIIKILSEIILIGVTTFFLIKGFGVLGIILGQIVSTTINVILILSVSIRKNILRVSLYFSFTKLKPFIKFGVYVSGKQVMTFLAHRLDQLIIGYFLAPEILGFYYFAKDMLEKLRSLITSSFSKVLFPLLSKLKNNKEKLTVAYQKITSYIAIFSFPVFIGVTLTAHLFVPVIFGEEWMESVPFFQVFSLALIPLVLTANLSSSLLYSVNRPDTVFYIDVIMNIIYIISLGIFSTKGVYVILAIYCGYVLLKTGTLQFASNKHLLNSFSKYLLSFKKVLLSSLFMAGSVVLIQYLMNNDFSALLQLVISIIVGAIAYILAAFLFDKKTLVEIKSAVFHNKLPL